MLPYTKKFATAHPQATSVLSVATSLVAVVGVVVFIQTRPESVLDPLWAATLFVIAAGVVGATAVTVLRYPLPTIGRSRARKQVRLSAFSLGASLFMLVIALVVGDLRDVAQAVCTASISASFLVIGWFSPRDAYF